jgi:hypothetical protein
MVEFAAHMDNSMCHNGTKVIDALNKANVIRALRLIDSLDLSPCDFWLFGMLKHQMTDRQLQNPKKILEKVTELWDEVAFEELQNVFLAWMERLQRVIRNDGEYFIN